MTDTPWTIYPCDCRDAMGLLMEPDSIDSIVTDPPYDLTSIVKRFGKPGSAPAQHGTDGAFARASAGFMGKQWDGTGVAFEQRTWAEAYRVLKPGGYLLAFGGTRTFHRMVCAIEDAGFEIRDCISWVYGSGFPKSLDVSKALDKQGQDAAQQWQGWGTALKPATEPICVARKPLSESSVAANVLRWGTGAINIDGARVGTGADKTPAPTRRNESTPWFTTASQNLGGDDTVGRFPANLIHDGSDAVAALFPSTEPRFFYAAEWGDDDLPRLVYCPKASKADRDQGLDDLPEQQTAAMQGNLTSGQRLAGDGTPIATPVRRNTHPTVKPESLMRYLVRLVTPPGGTVFDPFTGSGSTGKAALLEGFRFVGCELTPEYLPIIEARLTDAAKRASESV